MPANPPPAQLLPVDTHDLMCAILQHMNNDLMFVAHHMPNEDQARFHQLHTHVRQWLIDAPDAPEAAPSPERGELASLVEALHQYRNDMLYPPAPDSRERRIAMIDALIAALNGGAA